MPLLLEIREELLDGCVIVEYGLIFKIDLKQNVQIAEEDIK